MNNINNLWRKEHNALIREFEFAHFKDALIFINYVGELAQKINHHPDILLHNYNKVLITLSTHEVGKITKKDIQLAKKIDKLNYIR